MATIIGNDNNNNLIGTLADDLMQGLGGNDTLRGLAGKDTLEGGDGDDTLIPGLEADSVVGGVGEDYLEIDNSKSTAKITVNYTDASNGTITGGPNHGTTFQEIERITLKTGLGNDAINVSATSGYLASEIYAGGGHDQVIGSTTGYNKLYGEAGNDTLVGGNNDDEFYPGPGADSVVGGAGYDYLGIDNSHDRAKITVNYTDASNGTITGGSNQGTTFKEIERIYLKTGSGNDAINVSATSGYEDAVAIYAGSGHDHVIGSTTGYNKLNGEAGNDTLVGGNSYDYFYPGPGADNIVGGAGWDYLEIDNSHDTTNITINYTDASNGTITGGSNHGTTFKGIEDFSIQTGSGNDAINVSATNIYSYKTIIYAGGGHDQVMGSSGGDNVIYGKAGNDTITGGRVDIYHDFNWDQLYGGAGNDSLIGLSGTDYLYGEAGNDTLNGGNDNDYLYGKAGNDFLTGGNGDDYLDDELGNDTLNGGDGNDSLFPGLGSDSIIGGPGNDYLEIVNREYEDTVNITVNYTNTNNGTITGGFKDGTTFKGIERVFLRTGSGNDSINLSAAHYQSFDWPNWAVAVVSGSGNDHIIGSATSVNDLEGGAGNDTLFGGNGYSQLDPGTGVDSIVGGTGTDGLSIYNREDTANITVNYTDVNNGTITGGSNDGTTFKAIEGINLQTGSGNDYINVSATTEPYSEYWVTEIGAGAGNDQIIGSSTGYNILSGGDGNDLLYGSNAWGDDLSGDDGNDTLRGFNPKTPNSGEDEMDSLDGGAGRDLYILADGQRVYYDDGLTNNPGTNNYAELLGFTPNQDRVQLRGQPTDYLLQVSGSETHLLVNKPGSEPDELIAKFTNLTTGLDLNSASFVYLVTGTAGNDNLLGSDANDILTGLGGNDTLTGKGGKDWFAYHKLGDAFDIITDFTLNQDKIGLTGVLKGVGYTGGKNALSDGYVTFTAQGSNTVVNIDPDGVLGPNASVPLVLVQGVTVADLNKPVNFFF